MIFLGAVLCHSPTHLPPAWSLLPLWKHKGCLRLSCPSPVPSHHSVYAKINPSFSEVLLVGTGCSDEGNTVSIDCCGITLWYSRVKGSSCVSSLVEADYYLPDLKQPKAVPACLDVFLLSVNSWLDTASNRGEDFFSVEDLSFLGWSAGLSVRGWLDSLNWWRRTQLPVGGPRLYRKAS